MYDVAIVGAGPAGSVLARLLGDNGHTVILLEQHAVPGDEVNCSGIIGMEAFRRFDLPVEHVIRPIDRFRFISPGGAEIEYCHPETLAVAVQRDRFDSALAARAVAAGAELKTGARVDAVENTPRDVRLTLNHGASVIRSRFAVIATGAGSRLPEQLGFHLPQRYVLGAQMECDTVPLREVEIHLGQRIAPSNFGWVIPLEPGRAKVGLICESDATRALQRFLDDPALSGRILGRGRIRCSLLPLRTVPRSYKHRTIVVGEAAGQLKTITCGGIYYAMLAAGIAADVLHAALQSGASGETALAPYEERWRKLLEKELRVGRRLRSLFTRLSDDRIDALFDVAEQDGLMALIRDKANFDWHHDLVNAVLRHSLVRAVLRPVGYSRLLF